VAFGKETHCARLLPAVLVIASRAESKAWQSLAASFLSLRWSETTEAISLLVDRHTAFAMTILNLPAVLVIAME
jgi:hypothetical protein